jgi:hypothetical protein
MPTSLNAATRRLQTGPLARLIFRFPLGLALVAVAACHNTQSAPSAPMGVQPTSSGRVSAVPPNTTPYALFDSLGLIRSPDGHGVPSVRSIVVISFKDDAPQAERQAAVDAIHGVVVGGFRLVPIAKYYVRIPGTSFEDIMAACRRVSALTQVEFAAPLMKERLPGAGNSPSTAIRT